MSDDFHTHAHDFAEPPVVVRKDDCTLISGVEDVETARENGERVLSLRHGRLWGNYDDIIGHLENHDHPTPMIRAPDPLPDDPEKAETEAFYHITPELNVGDIEENGLDVTLAENAPTTDGVYVAPTRVDAENWAHTLCDEEGFVWFALYRVEVPTCLPILADERVRDPDVYPDSNVVATTYGIPPRFIEEVDRVKANAEYASEARGGVRRGSRP